ncbi:DUF4244 domain-containing protein [Streptomyces durbertensis]|uniref:DUF4244 domain-containing protein n=1 Tax=Streptomyces durbertensis TaxID=2448886 RepID=A0ABR6ECH9_9ACTN|nr:DUF4244 domain-containing protein [Streptomyces durbertensis]MBB1243031.1 DUF4244 domain-containing protein [Streptomyces durbertensis]
MSTSLVTKAATPWRTRTRRAVGRLRRLAAERYQRARVDDGMSTAEYAMATLAACAFAAVLYKVVTSGQVTAALREAITRALGGL